VVGIINTFDILTRVVFDKLFQDEGVKTEQLAKRQAEIATLLKKLDVSSASGISLESKSTWSYKHDDDLDKLLNVMSSGVHRVLVTQPEYDNPAVCDPAKHLGLISQRDVLRFLVDKKEKKMMKILSKPVREIAKSGVLYVNESATALKTFRRMVLENELSALPIVNEQGKLVDTVSSSDIRKVRNEHLSELLLPVGEFMKKAKLRSKGSSYQIKCRPDQTINEVLTMLLASKVHRAWVCDEEDKPTGALGFTDILKAVYLSDES
jgi:CBS domain-containing protein